MEHWTKYSRFFIALFAILDPVAAMPIFLVLTKNYALGDQRGQIGLNIINRLFGLILAAISVEIMANGLKQLFPALTGQSPDE